MAAQDQIEHAIRLQDIAKDDTDNRDCQDIGDKHQGPIVTPAADPFKNEGRKHQGKHDHDGNRDEQAQVVGERGPKYRISQCILIRYKTCPGCHSVDNPGEAAPE